MEREIIFGTHDVIPLPAVTHCQRHSHSDQHVERLSSVQHSYPLCTVHNFTLYSIQLYPVQSSVIHVICTVIHCTLHCCTLYSALLVTVQLTFIPLYSERLYMHCNSLYSALLSLVHITVLYHVSDISSSVYCYPL